MLYRLEIENFYSVRDRQVLDLRVGKVGQDNPEKFAPLFPNSSERVSKVLTLFGANGSGKSTVLKALTFLKWFLVESFQAKAFIPAERFNDTESANRRIRLALELTGPSGLTNEAITAANSSNDPFSHFRYELELNVIDGNTRSVHREALLTKPSGKGRWIRVFERSDDSSIVGSKLFSLSGFSQVIDKVRVDVSSVATLALFEHEASKYIVDTVNNVFHNILFDKTHFSDIDVVRFIDERPDVLTALNRELNRIDIGVEEMRVERTATGPIALFRHSGLERDMPWILESHGTREFIGIFPILLLALQSGGVAILDELDNSIHPLVLPEILRWFYSAERNPKNAQLWMSCHSASLLEELAKEEVILCEKDSKGRTTTYSLMDVQTVRRGENIYKKYLGGVYGGVPHIG